MAEERWRGVVQASSSCGGGSFKNSSKCSSQVTVSLCFCPSNQTLMTPSSNVIFFMGDRVDVSENTIIDRLSQPHTIASILVSKLGSSVNVWVVEPSHYKDSFACYENLLPSLSPSGEPSEYNPKCFPAARATLSLLRNCLTRVSTELLPSQRERIALGRQPEANENVFSTLGATTPSPTAVSSLKMRENCPPTFLFGFSKGGVVLNQVLAEMTHLEDLVSRKKKQQRQIRRRVASGESAKFGGSTCAGGCPFLSSSPVEFLRSIEQVHYVDVGLNCKGAYQTDVHVLEGLTRAAMAREAGLLVYFHGTPKQWDDRGRRWVLEEKEESYDILCRAAAKPGGNKLRVAHKLYFPGKRPNLQMHFEVIEELTLIPELGDGPFDAPCSVWVVH